MIYFTISIVLMALALLIFAGYKLGGVRQLFFYLKNNLGIVKGIVLFILVAIGSMFASKCTLAGEMEFFSYGKVYAGIDNTFNQSPQCHDGAISDRLTSNGGFVVNIMAKEGFVFDAKYTHHSCALNDDRLSYDAIGLVVEYRLW